MKKVLVVEDSTMVMKVLKHVMSQSEMVEPIYAMSFAETKAHVENKENEFFAAIVDLSLPDAPDGEVVDYVLSHKLPTIVLTGSFNEKRRENLLAKGIVDYVMKEGRYSYQYALGVVHRLIKNQDIKVLVVDDSAMSRKVVSGLLKLHMYQVLEAGDGVQAIKVVLENPDLKMLITDYNMPRMDGFDLVQNIRSKYEKSDLVIIGLSGEGESALTAKFIKNGANDFLQKPFNHEEFFCRVTHNIEFIELFDKIRDSANRDEVTGVFTRKYFFEKGDELWSQAQANGSVISAAVIDLDDFEHSVDVHGKDIRNHVIKFVADQLTMAFGRFLLARASTSQFYVLMAGLPNDKALALVERVRQLLGAKSVDIGEMCLSVTYSGGVSSTMGDSLDEMLTNAMKCLKRAREAGSDLVFGED